MTVKLDPRPSRTDLTSREVSTILGAALGPLLAGEVGRAEAPPDGVHAARVGLRIVIAQFEGRFGDDAEAATALVEQARRNPQAAAAAALIGGIATGLARLAPDESIRTALYWWDQDRAWDTLVTQVAEWGARFLSAYPEGQA